MTDLPIGTWTSATLLDAVGGRDGDRAAQRLIAIGIASALPTAASGLLDRADTEPADAEVRRVGVVHTTCPLHGSRFRLADDGVERGPSPYPQPTYEVREVAGSLQVRAAHGEPTL